MKADSTIARELRALRHLIETSPDALVRRVAYEIETAIRWAREDTVGWPRPSRLAGLPWVDVVEEIARGRVCPVCRDEGDEQEPREP